MTLSNDLAPCAKCGKPCEEKPVAGNSSTWMCSGHYFYNSGGCVSQMHTTKESWNARNNPEAKTQRKEALETALRGLNHYCDKFCPDETEHNSFDHEVSELIILIKSELE